jgi:hypothetical protein
MTTTTLPTIHLNGTGAKTLYKEYHAAWKAARNARTTLASATLNARDFYPQGNEAYMQARFQRDQYLANLDDLIEYLETWVMTALDHAAK